MRLGTAGRPQRSPAEVCVLGALKWGKQTRIQEDKLIFAVRCNTSSQTSL